MRSSVWTRVAPVRFANNARVSKKQVEPADFIRAVDEVQRGVDHPVYREAVSGSRDHSLHAVRHRKCRCTSPHHAQGSASAHRPYGLGGDACPAGARRRRTAAALAVSRGRRSGRWPSGSSLNTGNRFVSQHLDNEVERTLVAKFALAVATAEAQARLVFGDAVPPEQLREFLSLTLDHSASA